MSAEESLDAPRRIREALAMMEEVLTLHKERARSAAEREKAEAEYAAVVRTLEGMVSEAEQKPEDMQTYP